MIRLRAAMGRGAEDVAHLLTSGADELARLHVQTLQEKVEVEVASLQHQQRKAARGGKPAHH